MTIRPRLPGSQPCVALASSTWRGLQQSWAKWPDWLRGLAISGWHSTGKTLWRSPTSPQSCSAKPLFNNWAPHYSLNLNLNFPLIALSWSAAQGVFKGLHLSFFQGKEKQPDEGSSWILTLQHNCFAKCVHESNICSFESFGFHGNLSVLALHHFDLLQSWLFEDRDEENNRKAFQLF